MRRFTAALQPDTSIFANALLCEVDLVVPLHLPLGALELSAGHQVSRILEQRLVQVSVIACCYKDGIDVQRLLPFLPTRTLGEIQGASVLYLQTHTTLSNRRVSHVNDATVWHYTVRPVLFLGSRVAMTNAL